MQTLIKNKKILFIFLGIIIIVGIMFMVVNGLSSQYIIKVYKVDERSTDRKLKVYDKLDKEINYLEIRFTDNTYLCSSKNPTVYYGDIENIKELKIIISDNKNVVAKLIEE